MTIAAALIGKQKLLQRNNKDHTLYLKRRRETENGTKSRRLQNYQILNSENTGRIKIFRKTNERYLSKETSGLRKRPNSRRKGLKTKTGKKFQKRKKLMKLPFLPSHSVDRANINGH